jgi:hypothetical protein
MYKNDPRIIKARFDSKCKETGKKIKKGDRCVYYPSSKSVYCMDSKQASEFKSWQFDCQVLGHSY